MDADEFERPDKGTLLGKLLAEDIDALSLDELHARIAALRAEIERAEARLDFAANHKASADALFRK